MAVYGNSQYGITNVTFPAYYGGYIELADSTLVDEDLIKRVEKSLTDNALAGDALVKQIGKALTGSTLAGDALVKQIEKVITDGALAGESLAKQVGKALIDGALVSDLIDVIFLLYILTLRERGFGLHTRERP